MHSTVVWHAASDVRGAEAWSPGAWVEKPVGTTSGVAGALYQFPISCDFHGPSRALPSAHHEITPVVASHSGGMPAGGWGVVHAIHDE